MTTVLGIAQQEARGEALAGLFLAGYAGLAVPVVALGLATQLLSGRVAVLGVRGPAGGGGGPGQPPAAEDLSRRFRRVCPRSLG